MTEDHKFKRPKMRKHPRLVFRKIFRSWPFFVWLGVAVLVAWLYTDSIQFGSMTGVIETLAENVAPLEAARLLSVEVTVGQEVKAGEVVAYMDTSLLNARIAIDEARVIEAEGTISTYQQDVMQTAARSDQTIQQVEFDLEDLKIQQRRDQAELTALDEELKRRERLLAEHMINIQDVNVLRPQVAALSSTVGSYPSLILLHERRLVVARKERQRLDEWLQLEEGEDISSAIQRWMATRNAIFDTVRDRRRTQLATYVLKTTQAGVVSRLEQMPGEIVGAGETVLRIVQKSSSTIIGFLPEAYLGDMSVGQTVIAWSHGREDHRTAAVVESISPDIQALPGRVNPMGGQTTRGRRVIMRMDDSKGMIPGETVQIRLGGSKWMVAIRNLLHGTSGEDGTEEGNAQN